MTNILLCGACGKMGHAVARATEDSGSARIVAGYDIKSMSDSNFPVYTSLSDVREDIDVIIDFSHPTLTENVLAYCADKKIPAVICTTGLGGEQIAKINSISASIPIFFSANMSLGVNLLIDLAKRASKLLEDNFDIEIIEKHHNQKIDAPSGTALAIADAISDAVSYEPEYTYDRHSVRQKRDKREIGIHAVRGGTIVGEHSIIFAGCDEVIELKHCATSKEVFAVGAIKAAIFLKDLAPGLYSMSDLIASQQ